MRGPRAEPPTPTPVVSNWVVPRRYNGDTDPGINSFVSQNWTVALGLSETKLCSEGAAAIAGAIAVATHPLLMLDLALAGAER